MALFGEGKNQTEGYESQFHAIYCFAYFSKVFDKTEKSVCKVFRTFQQLLPIFTKWVQKILMNTKNFFVFCNSLFFFVIQFFFRSVSLKIVELEKDFIEAESENFETKDLYCCTMPCFEKKWIQFWPSILVSVERSSANCKEERLVSKVPITWRF